MKILKFLIQLSLLALYGYLFFLIVAPPNIDIYHTPHNKLLEEYDYIVIGAGSAGSVVSSRLAERNHKVLVLEAGVSNNVDVVTLPAGFPAVFMNPNFTYLDWGNSAPFASGFVKNKQIPFPRGKVIGGCGSINGNILNIGNHKIYDKWEEMGAQGWKYREIEKYFKKAEESLWVQYYPGRFIHKSMRDWLDVARKLYGKNEDFNKKSLGFGVYDTTMRNGRRWSTADAYLKPNLRRYPDSFHLSLNSTVDKILFNKENNRAVGVLLEDNKVIKAKKEIILSAGTLNSPTILMRSGVGEQKELEKFGIKLIRELPGVGKNLQSHPTISFIVQTDHSEWDTVQEEPPKISKLIDYLIFGTGTYSSNLAEVGGYIQTKHAHYKDIEDVQIHCASTFYGSQELIEQNQKERPNHKTEKYLTCVITAVSVRDKGTVSLKSLNPNDNLNISLNYLKHPEDLNSFFEGITVIDKIFGHDDLKGKVHYIFPKKEELADTIKLTEYIYNSLFEIYHPTGTCKMGDFNKDLEVVVDNNLKVIGFENLRVIDASIMPEIVNSNTNGPTIIIAEKGADLILNGK